MRIDARGTIEGAPVAPSGEGAGLGLSVVRSVAEAHGGEARIESALGSGTRVEMILPRRLPAPAATPDAMAGVTPL